MDLAVDEMVWGRMYNTGQVCCASKRFLIHNSLKDEFAEEGCRPSIKAAQLSAILLNDDTQIACLISEKAAIKVEKEVASHSRAGRQASSWAARETALSMNLPLS